MRIRIGNLSSTYALLGSIESCVETEESSPPEFSNQDSEKTATLKILTRGINISYNQAELFSPLDFADFFVKRKGNDYAAGIIIKARDPTAFRNLSFNLIESFKDKNLDFSPTTKHGEGYVIEKEFPLKEKYPSYSIIGEGPFRIICAGSKGAERMIFPDEERFFRESMARLENITDIFIDTVYKKHNAQNSIVKVPEDFVIEIN